MNPYDIYRASMDGAERGRERGLASLLGKAYNAPRERRQGILGQVAGLGAPDAAAQMQKQFDANDATARERLAEYALAFDALPDDQKPMAYPQFAQQAQTLGIPAPMEWKPEFAPNIQKLAMALGRGASAAGVQSTYVDAAGNRVAIMRDGSTQVLGQNDAGMANQTITVEGPNGEPVQMTFNKRTGTYQPLSMGRDPMAQPPVTLGQPMPFTIGADIPPQVAAQIRAQEEAAGGRFMGAPTMQSAALPPPLDYQGGGQIGVGMTAADKAAAQEAAKQGVQTQFLSAQERIKTEAAIATERGKQQAQADVKRDTATIQKSATLRMYETAMQGLRSGLAGTETGPIAGRIPAVTSSQQIAEGAVAAMAPILKQLFRAAGEGTFTDRDQALLLEMVPKRTDTPEAREVKMANIDKIVRAKLGGDEGPQRGDVQDGYRFKGGDPSNPNSWERL